MIEFKPINLFSYVSDTQQSQTLYWYLEVDATSDVTGIPDHEIHVQVDDTTGFTMPEDFLFSLDSTSVINGNLIEGISYPFVREQEDQLKYWKVQNIFIDPTGDPSGATDWSDISSFTIFSNDATAIADYLLSTLPEDIVYKQDSRDTNIYKSLNTYSNEFDLQKFELFLTETDLNLNDIRDSRIYAVFGYLFDLRKPFDLTFPEYKELLKLLTDLSYYGGTYKAIKDICKFFTGVDPIITLIRDLGDLALVGSDTTGDLYDVTGSFIEDATGGIDADYIWAEDELATGFLVNLINKYSLTLNIDLITYILELYKPGNSKIYILGV